MQAVTDHSPCKADLSSTERGPEGGLCFHINSDQQLSGSTGGVNISASQPDWHKGNESVAQPHTEYKN